MTHDGVEPLVAAVLLSLLVVVGVLALVGVWP